jgi:hypothetical protein
MRVLTTYQWPTSRRIRSLRVVLSLMSGASARLIHWMGLGEFARDVLLDRGRMQIAQAFDGAHAGHQLIPVIAAARLSPNSFKSLPPGNPGVRKSTTSAAVGLLIKKHPLLRTLFQLGAMRGQRTSAQAR